MLSADTSIPTSAMRLTSLSLVIGLLVMLGSVLLIIAGALWAVSYGIMLFLSHTSSVQLLIMLVVAFEAYRLAQTIKAKRGVL